MEKRFLEVFPELQIGDSVKKLFEKVAVTKVAVTSSRELLRVYIISETWIHKKYIRMAEKAIKDQCFSDTEIDVKIIEKFHLSGQYTAENFFPDYRDSVLLELRDYSIFEYNLLRQAEYEFTAPDEMILTIEESVVLEGKAEELIRILEKIFCERCGLHLKITLKQKVAQMSKARKNSDLLIEQEVAAIAERLRKNREAGVGEEADKEELMIDTAAKLEKKEAKTADRKIEETKKAAEVKKPAQEQKKSFGNGGFSRKGGGDYRRALKRSDNPDVIYGRDIDDEAIEIRTIEGEMGEVVIRGCVRSLETRDIRNEKTIIMMDITDFTDTITVKIFLATEQVPELTENLKKGAFVKLKGVTTIDRFDSQLTIGSVVGIKKISDFRTGRMDTWPEKRVELHCHTKMSDMDGVSEVKDIVKQAYKWGHSAIAITDHGALQSFPDANHFIEDIDRAYRTKYQAEHPDVTKEELKLIHDPFKVIYGVEAYLVDDSKDVVMHSKGQNLQGNFVVFDLETTGFSPVNNRIIEIGAVKVEHGEITDRFSTFVNPQVPIPFRIEELTSINDNMVMDAPAIEEILPQFLEFVGDAVLVAHNAGFDVSFIEENCRRLGQEQTFTYLDTVALARILLPQLNRFKLDTVAKALHINLHHHHRAVDDAECTAEIFLKFAEMLEKQDVFDLDGINELGSTSLEQIKKLPTYHAIILAKNEIGRINLYRLVSWSHLQYYNRRPRIPKSAIQQYREGLILGSACEAGELFQAILEGKTEQEVIRIANFYDYLEIQPIGNNAFMIREEDREDIKTEKDLQDLNRKIVKLGEQLHKPVLATCDVHFLNPEDEIYRRIIMAGKGFKDADQQAPLFLHTTEEMMKEFAYLGQEKAEEVVITNPNKIADMCEHIAPVRPDKCPPVIENSDKTLREICYNRAHEIYGEDLPPIVSERLERELNSIISNGFAVMYIIAQKLVWKSNEDGYLVGSRGSVGSSFVATMAGITEVNPLSPHYLCEYCHFVDFDSEEVKAYSGRAGCDMPDRKCPVCGKDLKKEGFDIPFETFLGFKGNKEPDIDLNFSGDYQSKAHKYTEVIFGEGQTFKAGTIGTLADKTAFGYIKNYYEERGIHKRNCEIDRIVQGCVGVRRTTGQHPGGIIVLPVGEDIFSFTPVQHPANDMTSDIITTHFDYHSIDANLLKLDILGHDDPTMIRMLEDLTGLHAQEIPLDDKTVMSLFKNTSALGVTPEELNGCPMGTLGIPEFGTDFAMGMLRDAKPQEFTDLIRISGLSHGTDVWLGNAQTLIENGTATISTCICTRDDIMTYLIHMGLDSAEAFDIMEKTRKGIIAKGKCKQWPEWKQDMLDHGVPEWYTWSCEKIKYMFPKAHAAAYVMMAWRIAYCKVFYPLAYYAAFFSIRATSFSYELMCQGKDKLEFYIAEYKKKDKLSAKEEGTLRDMRIVQEMYARGFEFLPLDLYKSDARYFQIVDGKLLPPFNSIDGMGDKAAESLAIAASGGKFLSKDDLRERGKVSKSIIELLSDLDIISDLPESNQLSFFDFTA